MIGRILLLLFPILLSFYLGFTEYNVLWDKPKALADPLFNYKHALALKIVTFDKEERVSVTALGKLDVEGPEVLRYRELSNVVVGDTRYVIAATDVYLWKGIWLTLRYAVLSIPLGIIGALAVALLLNQRVKGVGYWRTLYYLPAVLPAAAVALLWFWLFAPNRGLINWALGPLYDLTNTEPLGWFTDKKLVLPSFVIMSMWGIFGANAVILLAGLKNIPPELYEAASIDGAGTLVKFRRITIPMLSPTLFYTLITGLIGALQLFTEQAFIPTEREDGWFVNWFLYNEAFNFGQMGYASAVGWLYAILIIMITLIVFRSSAAWVFYEGARGKDQGGAA
ncbi:MAG: sugar ABC transporter permease [Chloroflexi bacterium]|nr:sugar ABC transporter permease [Chloroflexota bacterium]